MDPALPPLVFIGGGNMATAMIASLLALPSPPRIAVAEPDPGKRADLAARGCLVHTDGAAALACGSVVILAIKPQLGAAVVPSLAPAWTPEHLLVSILAGTPTARLASWLPPRSRIVRAMPNTPLAIGRGMVGLCRGAHAGSEDLALATALFAPCAKVLHIAAEERMDAVTAVSGSGPAYVFAFAEALLAGAVDLGFTPEEAMLLVGQTVAGSWDYLLQSGQPPSRLREQVTSPGGTTAAALEVLARGDFHGLIARALQAAQRRGRELAVTT